MHSSVPGMYVWGNVTRRTPLRFDQESCTAIFSKKIYHITTGTICLHVFLSFPTNPTYICTYSRSMGASRFKFLKQTSETSTDCFSLVKATTHTNTDWYHFPVFHFLTNTSPAASHTWLSTPLCHLAFQLIFSSHATTDRPTAIPQSNSISWYYTSPPNDNMTIYCLPI